MNKIILPFFASLVSIGLAAQAPQPVSPVIKSIGSVYEIPHAVEKPDPNMVYNIIIEVERESDRPDTVNWALTRVASLLNLHAVGGINAKNMNVVLAIHGGATYTTMNNAQYREWYKVDNPNMKLYQELQAAGVKMFFCGQSIIRRKVDRSRMLPEIQPALSMLTTVTTYQLKGYAYVKF